MNDVLVSECSLVTAVCLNVRVSVSAKSLPVNKKGVLYKTTYYQGWRNAVARGDLKSRRAT